MEAKRCKKCGQEKTLSAFYSHEKMADGHLNICKECTKIRIAEHRKKNLDRIREYDRNRPNIEERNEQRRARSARNPSRTAKVKKAWRDRNHDKRSAHQIVQSAIKRGDLVRASSCERCGYTDGIEGHHPDYNKPLHVVWLCDKCHKMVHKEARAAIRLLPSNVKD